MKKPHTTIGTSTHGTCTIGDIRYKLMYHHLGHFYTKPRLKRIKTLEQLNKVVREKGSVIGSFAYRQFPAAWVINWPGSVLLASFQKGMYVYKSKKKVKKQKAKATQ